MKIPPKLAVSADYMIAAALSVAISVVALQLWNAQLKVPFNYTTGGQDSFFNMMVTKTSLETGWIFHNPHLGAPGTLNQLDFPMLDSLHFALIRATGWITGDYGSAINLYYLLTFPLLAISTLYAARSTYLSRSAAMVVSQLSTFLPFHLMRGETHLTLEAFYLIPLTLPAILQIARGERIRKLWWIAGPTFALIGISNVYHAAFCGFFTLIAVFVGCVQRQRQAIGACVEAGVLTALIALTFGLQLIPIIANRYAAGPNPGAFQRTAADADIYGLKFAQIVLPVPGHRLSYLRNLRTNYVGTFPNVNENESAALGILGTIGFLSLLARIFLSIARQRQLSPPTPRDVLLDTLSIFTLAAFLLATVGGIGSVFDYLVFVYVRAFNRIVIYVGLFALLAFASGVDRFMRNDQPRRLLWLLLLVLGLLDQIPGTIAPHYAQNAADFESDDRFVHRIESMLPRDSMVFQLPIVLYPESAPAYLVSDYELFRGYLHSTTLRWSYGAIKGREQAAWQSQLIRMPFPNIVDAVRHRGFAGIYFDRYGFAAAEPEIELTRLLGTPIVSPNGRLLFFPFITH